MAKLVREENVQFPSKLAVIYPAKNRHLTLKLATQSTLLNLVSAAVRAAGRSENPGTKSDPLMMVITIIDPLIRIHTDLPKNRGGGQMPPDPLVPSALSLVQFWLLSVSVLNEQQGVFLTVWRQQLDTVQYLNFSFYIPT